ncbi:hypothetical protein PV326_009304, partial [Microctonus aethiopoides]
APQIGPFSMSDGPANWRDMVSATCSIVKGDFPVEIVWRHNGHDIDSNNPDITITRINKHMSAISIESVAARHAGDYTCIATNRAGNVSHSTSLAILPFAFGDEPANSDDAVSVTCSISKGDLPLDIAWAFNDEPLTQHRPDITITVGKRHSMLAIDSVAARHVGEYTCTASNKAGATSHTAMLAVNVAPQIAPFSIGEEPANWGEQVSAICSVLKGDQPIEIRWSHNDMPITRITHPDVVITKTGRMNSLLSIDSVTAKHAGDYSCEASNQAGSTSRSAVLSVNVAPQILPLSFGDEPVNAGDLASIQCAVSKGDFPLDITWMFDGHTIGSERLDIVVANSGKRVKQLTIDAVAARHAGEYTCIASNIAGTSSHSAILDVNVIPKLLPVSFGEEPLNSGQVVIVPCAVTEGDPPLKLRWTLNNHSISPHSGVAILDLGGRGAILSIGSVQATHAGTYTCIAENLAGRHELSADLIVNGDTPITLKWLFEGRHLEMGEGVKITSLGDRVSALTIPDVRGEHAGEYACVADNPAGRTRHSAHLKVNVLPRITPSDFGEQPIYDGQAAQFACMVPVGDTPINITWTHDRKPLSLSLPHSIGKLGPRTSILLIDPVTSRHAGIYACIATNPSGKTIHEAALIVHG